MNWRGMWNLTEHWKARRSSRPKYYWDSLKTGATDWKLMQKLMQSYHLRKSGEKRFHSVGTVGELCNSTWLMKKRWRFRTLSNKIFKIIILSIRITRFMSDWIPVGTVWMKNNWSHSLQNVNRTARLEEFTGLRLPTGRVIPKERWMLLLNINTRISTFVLTENHRNWTVLMPLTLLILL